MSALQDVPAQRSTAALKVKRRKRWHRSSRFRIHDERDVKVAKYGDTSATYWKLYGSEAEVHDKKFIESLRGDTNSMVFLSGLFSAIVAGFIIEIYKTLLPDSGQQTVNLLSQLVLQSPTSQFSSPSNFNDQSFNPPNVAIRINMLLFFSFFLSIMSAMACALILQWCHDYMQYAYPRAAPHECGRIRTYLYRGLHRFHMRRFMYGTHVLLHISVFLFFGAISEFFYTIHTSVGAISRYCLFASMGVYLALSIFPLIFSNSPYNTPLTPLLRANGNLLYSFWTAVWYTRRDPSKPLTFTWRPYFKGVRFNRAQLFLFEAQKQAAVLESYAMEWLLTKNDLSDDDMDKFLESLPGYISSRHTNEAQLYKYLTADYVLERIREHFLTCVISLELSEEAIISRVWCCTKSLWLIFRRSIVSVENPSAEDKKKLQLQKTYIEEIISDLQSLCLMEDPMVALRASCIRGLAVQDILTNLTQSDGAMKQIRPFLMSLIPIYTLFFPKNNEDAIQRLGEGRALNVAETNTMWKDLLSDGPLVNLTLLAENILLREDAPPSRLSFCWKTLEILLKQLGIAPMKVSLPTLNRFNAVHKSIREYAQETERGFRIAPLLDILDVVARGRRLSLAFSGHPQYHSRADVVFGKEHLRNGDLLEAFARCLPDYIAKLSLENGREFMEGIVCDDDLWTSLQVNLWNAQRSNHPTPNKLRVFEDCCTVLDVALSSLEDSTKVDCRAPEFGSLVQSFESFIAHCFHGSFMGRATNFRIGVIRVRCSKALLTQFYRDFVRDGTIFFLSQWDVASLARLFWTLGIGDGKDAEFWKSCINGGHIGSAFTTKASGMIDRAARDGPLLIFCNLVRLATTAVPLHGSGLGAKDLLMVWELLWNMIKNQQLPLDHASDEVWNKLGSLRAEVSHLCGKMSGIEGDKLRSLIGMIDEARYLGSKGRSGEGASPVNPTEDQDHNFNQSSFSSEPAAGTGRRFSAIQTIKDNFEEPSPDTVFFYSETKTPALSSSPYNMDSPITTVPLLQSVCEPRALLSLHHSMPRNSEPPAFETEWSQDPDIRVGR